jgi:hypothetical protein
MPLSAKQERIALELASGRSVARVAKEHGAGVRTIRRWQAENNHFQERVDELQREIIGQAVGILVGQTGKAAQTLGELLHSDSDSIRLQAARSIFELCPKTLEKAPVVAQGPASPDYGDLALSDPVAAQLVVQLLSRAAARAPKAVECVVQPVAPVAPAADVPVSAGAPGARNGASAAEPEAGPTPQTAAPEPLSPELADLLRPLEELSVSPKRR